MTTSEIKKRNEAVINKMAEDMMSVLRNTLNELGGEYALVCNPYGFVTAWLEGDEVWWDKDGTGPKNIGELTELSALYDVIIDTINDIENQED